MAGKSKVLSPIEQCDAYNKATEAARKSIEVAKDSMDKAYTEIESKYLAAVREAAMVYGAMKRLAYLSSTFFIANYAKLQA